MELKRGKWLLLLAILAVGVIALFLRHPPGNERQDREPERLPQTSTLSAAGQKAVVKSPDATPAQPLFGERILAHYGDPARPPEEDLVWVARALDNFALLVKGDNPLPLGANEDIANALRGKNPAQLRALPDHHPAFNASGQLVDRWGTPLYFHATAHDRIDIRSAGPDREMWTTDDHHRRADGRFLPGAELLVPSLFDDPALSR